MYGGDVGVPGGMTRDFTCSTLFAKWYGGDSGENDPVTLCRLCGLVDMGTARNGAQVDRICSCGCKIEMILMRERGRYGEALTR